MKNINQTVEQEKSSSKKANTVKTLAAAALITVAGAVNAQNSATIDPKYYSISNPYEIPNLQDKTLLKLIIKTGQPVPVKISGMDTGSSTFITDPDGNNVPLNDIITINKPGSRVWEYKENGVTKTTPLRVIDQTDIINETEGSATKNQRPEIIMIDAGQNATLSAGPNMGYYRWRNMDESLISGGYTDSTIVVGSKSIISETRDKSGILPDGLTRDTIAVIERPSANASARTLNFTTTVSGVNYKVYKFQPAAAGAPMSKAPSENQTDSAWVEIPSLSFVGDGNPRSIGVELGSYRIGAQRTASTAVQQDTKSIKVDVGTDVLEVNTEEKNTFKQANRELSRETEVPSIIYDIHGREMGTALASTIRIPDQATDGVYIVRFTENGKIHTKKIVIK